MTKFRATSIASLLYLGRLRQVEGNVVAEEVMVRGRLIGSVRALKVMLQSTVMLKATSSTRNSFSSRARTLKASSRVPQRLRYRPRQSSRCRTTP